LQGSVPVSRSLRERSLSHGLRPARRPRAGVFIHQNLAEIRTPGNADPRVSHGITELLDTYNYKSMKRLGYAFYYLVISRLPHSRFSIVFNRIRVWYLCRVLRVMEPGEMTYCEHHVFIGGPGRVKFGRSCQINENTFIETAEIGNFVMIAPNVAILSSMHNHDRLDIPMILQGATIGRKVIIEDDVWLGRNVLVMPGIRIGKGSIVAAGAVVTRDVPEYKIVGGVPARIIKDRRQ
jgi:acetyltransferase-like isoleucine patch superfamily enzyme